MPTRRCSPLPRERAPELTWIESDVGALDLGRVFDVVVMAGNVPLFTPAGSQEQLVAGCARHVASDGVLVAGFQLDRGYELATYDEQCAIVGLEPVERFATWDGEPFPGDGSYVVSIHRRTKG